MANARLEVRLSDQVNERLEALAAAEGLTKTNVFRRVSTTKSPSGARSAISSAPTAGFTSKAAPTPTTANSPSTRPI